MTDFNRLPEQLHSKEKGGDHLWFENNVQAYFDDEEPFRLVKAMCRLYCSVCELATPAGPDDTAHKGTVKKGHIFKSIESLRRHLFSAHRLIMCELCLEGRKVIQIRTCVFVLSLCGALHTKFYQPQLFCEPMHDGLLCGCFHRIVYLRN